MSRQAIGDHGTPFCFADGGRPQCPLAYFTGELRSIASESPIALKSTPAQNAAPSPVKVTTRISS